MFIFFYFPVCCRPNLDIKHFFFLPLLEVDGCFEDGNLMGKLLIFNVKLIFISYNNALQRVKNIMC